MIPERVGLVFDGERIIGIITEEESIQAVAGKRADVILYSLDKQ